MCYQEKCRPNFAELLCLYNADGKYCRLLVTLILRCSWVSEHVCSCLCLAGSGWWSGIVLHSNYNVHRRRKSLTEAMMFIIYYIEDWLFFFSLSVCLFFSLTVVWFSFITWYLFHHYFPHCSCCICLYSFAFLWGHKCVFVISSAVCLCTIFTTDLNI